jgi:hypothetical protein
MLTVAFGLGIWAFSDMTSFTLGPPHIVHGPAGPAGSVRPGLPAGHHPPASPAG